MLGVISDHSMKTEASHLRRLHSKSVVE